MKRISVILFVLTLWCQIVYSQESRGNIKSVSFNTDSISVSLDSNVAGNFLKSKLNIAENYEFRNKVILGTKGKTRETDDLGYVHERYAQYYKGIKIEHSDIRTHYLNNRLVYVNGEYIDVPNIDTSIVISQGAAVQKAINYVIDVSKRPNAMYFVTFHCEGQKVTKKLVKQ